jgi:pilus assembly protein Flp/PilA
MAVVRAFRKCDRGATAIEYGLIAGLISIVFLVALTAVGQSTLDLYEFVAEQLTTALSSV